MTVVASTRVSGTSPLGVLLHQEEAAKSYAAYFEMLWQQASATP